MTDHDLPAEEDYGSGKCAACGRRCQRGYLMCRTHWYRVGSALRISIYTALQHYEDLPNSANLNVLRNFQRMAVKVATQ